MTTFVSEIKVADKRHPQTSLHSTAGLQQSGYLSGVAVHLTTSLFSFVHNTTHQYFWFGYFRIYSIKEKLNFVSSSLLSTISLSVFVKSQSGANSITTFVSDIIVAERRHPQTSLHSTEGLQQSGYFSGVAFQ